MRLYAGLALGAGVVVLVAVLWFGAGAQEIAGLPTAGPLTDWGLPLVRFLYDGCAAACVGTLLASAVLAPASSPESSGCLRASGRWALGWAVTALLSYTLTLSSFLPIPVFELLAKPEVLGLGPSLPQTQALLVVSAVAVVVAAATAIPRLPRWVPLVVAVFGLLPPAYVGHAASSGDHNLAISALMAHLVAMSLWVGGLGAVLFYFRRSGDLAVVLSRFSVVALCCFAAMACSGVISAWVRLNTPSDLWLSKYGGLILAKVAVLAILAWFGWIHRSRTITAILDRGARRPFVRLAMGEVVVMVVAVGLAVGLSRTPPPAGGGHEHLALEISATVGWQAYPLGRQ